MQSREHAAATAPEDAHVAGSQARRHEQQAARAGSFICGSSQTASRVRRTLRRPASRLLLGPPPKLPLVGRASGLAGLGAWLAAPLVPGPAPGGDAPTACGPAAGQPWAGVAEACDIAVKLFPSCSPATSWKASLPSFEEAPKGMGLPDTTNPFIGLCTPHPHLRPTVAARQEEHREVCDGQQVHKTAARFRAPPCNQVWHGLQPTAWLHHSHLRPTTCGTSCQLDTPSQARHSGRMGCHFRSTFTIAFVLH